MPTNDPSTRPPPDAAPAKLRPLRVRYAAPPPKAELTWLEVAHFMPPDHETVLLAWPRTEGFTFRTGRLCGGGWLLSHGQAPREKPTFYASLKA